jgi:acyl phosphate:glycerol-3-phosphate acyltransferase
MIFGETIHWPAAGLSLIAGYLLGSIPFGLIFAWLAGAGDVRKIGSGNIGATNVLRTGKVWAAVATLIFDAAKGAAAVLIAAAFYGKVGAVFAALGAFLGHLFPVWLGFKGGKGIATAFGVSLALSWPAALAMGATWAIVAAISRISSLSALITAVLAPLYMYYFAGPLTALLMVILAVLVFIMHRANIARLLNGTEPRIGAKKTP